MRNKPLEALIEAHFEGRLTAAEAAELSRALATDAAARRQFWEQAAVHGLLQEAARLEWLGTAAPEPGNRVVRVSWWRRAAPVLAAAAVLLLLAILWRGGVTGEERVSNGVAVLAQVVGVEWADAGAARSPGAVLSPGTLRLKSGAVQVEFYSGARVVVEGPAEFRLVSTREGYLATGRLTAQVPELARGFRVGSGRMTVVDLGTAFGMSVVTNRVPEVHVFTGRVTVARPTGGAPATELTGGQAVRVEVESLVPLPADRARFLGEAELAQRASADGRQRQAAWEKSAGEWGRDPALLAHFTFANEQPWNRVLTNRAAGTQGDIVGCQWAEGRWPGKTALQFKGSGDRVRLEVPGALKAVTLLTWVRVEALPNNFHALLMPEGQAPGTLRWELTRAGQLRLGIARESTRPEPNWEAVMTPPVITPERLGQWVQLATTFDGQSVSHYLNGELAGTGAALSPAPLVIGPAELGNWRGNAPRHLVAGMDEFALLGRAITAGEVRRAFELGRPTTAWTRQARAE
jgi:hypothetical protein